MVEVDGVSLEDGVAVGCCWVDILVDLPGVERCVVKVAYGEGDGVGIRWLEANISAHQVLGEGLLSVGVEVKASTACAAAKGSAAAASPTRRSGVGVVVAIVGGRHYFVSTGCMSRSFKFVRRSSGSEMRFMMVVVAASI